jgi:diguanylate cyclase (GGDEF)-like protein
MPESRLKIRSPTTAPVAAPWDSTDLANPINQLPVPITCMDYSPIRRLFQSVVHDGVSDLPTYFANNIEPFQDALLQLRVVAVNQQHLLLHGSSSLAEAQLTFNKIALTLLLPGILARSLALWRGETIVTSTTERLTFDNRYIVVYSRASIMTGHAADWSCVLLTSEDITEQRDARKRLLETERYNQALFQLAPVSLDVEDFSALKTKLDSLRAGGVTDIKAYAQKHPNFAHQCFTAIRVVEFNQQTVALYKAASKDELWAYFAPSPETKVPDSFVSEMENLWQGRLPYTMEATDYDLEGNQLELLQQVAIIPGHEHDWSRVLVSRTDFTARRQAERQLEYISWHDELTRLYNRAFFNQKIERLRREGPFPASVIVADLNGLKPVNDKFGHEAGDELLCRAAALLRETAGEAAITARLGGDEFVILLPGKSLGDAERLRDAISKTLRYAPVDARPAVSLSMGCAACEGPESINEMLKLSDQLMYRAKRAHYANQSSSGVW